MSGSGTSWAICKSAPRSRQITMPASHQSVFYRLDALPAAQLKASKHWRHTSTKVHFQKSIPTYSWFITLMASCAQKILFVCSHSSSLANRHSCVTSAKTRTTKIGSAGPTAESMLYQHTHEDCHFNPTSNTTRYHAARMRCITQLPAWNQLFITPDRPVLQLVWAEYCAVDCLIELWFYVPLDTK